MKKKWLAVLEDDQYKWVKETANEIDTNGSAVIRAVIDRARTMDFGDFKKALAESQIKNQLEKLNKQKAELEEQVQELRQRMKNR